jgi:hypothetical protein
MSKKFKASEIKDAIIEIGEERPDYINEQDEEGKCFYQIDGKPSCIVGQALSKLGADAELLRKLDEENKGGVSADAVFTHFPQEFEDDDYKAKLFMGQVQANQDNRAPWGEAIEEAKEYLK